MWIYRDKFIENTETKEKKRLFSAVFVRDKLTQGIVTGVLVDGDETGVILKIVEQGKEIDLRTQFNDNERYEIIT